MAWLPLAFQEPCMVKVYVNRQRYRVPLGAVYEISVGTLTVAPSQDWRFARFVVPAESSHWIVDAMRKPARAPPDPTLPSVATPEKLRPSFSVSVGDGRVLSPDAFLSLKVTDPR